MQFTQVLAVAVVAAVGAVEARATLLDRDRDPVLIVGQALSALWDLPVGEITDPLEAEQGYVYSAP